MRRLLLCLVLAAGPACSTEIGGEWHLIGLEGQPATAPLSLTFAAGGKF